MGINTDSLIIGDYGLKPSNTRRIFPSWNVFYKKLYFELCFWGVIGANRFQYIAKYHFDYEMNYFVTNLVNLRIKLAINFCISIGIKMAICFED